MRRKRTKVENTGGAANNLLADEECKDGPKLKTSADSALVMRRIGKKKASAKGIFYKWILEGKLKINWTAEETRKLLNMFKVHGSCWSIIAKSFNGKTDNDVKNKFYTTLKRVATRAQLENPNKYGPEFLKCKQNLLQFVDAAIQHAEQLPSKRGRKKNIDKIKAKSERILFPRSPPLISQPRQPASSIQQRCPPPPSQTMYLSTPIIGVRVMPMMIYPLPAYPSPQVQYFRQPDVGQNSYYSSAAQVRVVTGRPPQI